MTKDPGFEEAMIKQIENTWHPMVEAMERAMGPAFGTKPYTKEEQIRLATFTPYPDPARRQQQIISLLQQGKSAEEVTDAIYPKLRGILKLAGPSIKDQIAYAKRLRTMIDQSDQQQQTVDLANEFVDLVTGQSVSANQTYLNTTAPDLTQEETTWPSPSPITPETTPGPPGDMGTSSGYSGLPPAAPTDASSSPGTTF